VVTDIRLHGAITGWDVANAFRAANPDIGVIYASGNPALAERRLPEASSSASPSASTN
jgi:hypothetical protein